MDQALGLHGPLLPHREDNIPGPQMDKVLALRKNFNKGVDS